MKNELSNNEYFQTSDLTLCATLCCFGYIVDTIDNNNPSKSIFFIKRNNKLDDVIKNFWQHKLKVEPSVFFNWIKELKNRIYIK
jgi:hypothetical protein